MISSKVAEKLPVSQVVESVWLRGANYTPKPKLLKV
jgi:hypothetical protein